MTNLFMDVHFSVYRSEDNILIFEDTLPQGSVFWSSSYVLSAVYIEEKTHLKKKYRYDVLLKRKVDM